MRSTSWRAVGRLAVVLMLAALPVMAEAQEAAVSGSVTDTTGGVLPGVTLTAVHETTGNTFVAVTDERGGFRMPLRIGPYRIDAELGGFSPVSRRMELLVGQTALITLQMAPSGVSESVTVSAEAALLDQASSTLASNINPKQLSELPVNGRNWLDLAMLAPGSRLNASTDEPGGVGSYQVNVDGLRVTQNQTNGFGQPHYSRDAIAEFEFVSGRFDATQGGSMGLQINAVTKSGTNTFGGSLSGYFRDDRLIAKDFVQRRVLPYSDQQFSGTFGGPILRDRLHFFANYEFERQPQTYTFSSPYPSFNLDLNGIQTEKKGGARLDYQISPQTHLTVRGGGFEVWMPYDSRYTGGASRHPSSAIQTTRHSNDLLATLTQVLGAKAVNELRVGYNGFYWVQDSVLPWPNHPYPGLTYGSPILQLRGYTIGQAHQNSHEYEDMENYSARENLSVSFSARGRHDVRIGAEYLHQENPVFLCNKCMGIYDMTGGSVPKDIETIIPVWNDVSTWDLAALSKITRFYTLGIGQMSQSAPLDMFAAWVQDDWQVTQKLTLNLGLRYDVERGAYAERVGIEPFLPANRSIDVNNFGPRLGFAYQLTDRTVVRGGGGLYYADPGSQVAYWTRLWSESLHPQVLNDGRADFAANPFNGPVPTYEEVAATLCRDGRTTGCLRRSIPGTLAGPTNDIPYSYQSSVGVQRQFGREMVFEADYVYIGNRKMLTSLQRNLAYNPATGANYRYTDLAHLPYPEWGDVQQRISVGQSNYHAMQLSFTKRFSDRWQASATYLLAGQWNLQAPPILPGCEHPTTLDAQGRPVCDQPVTLAEDLRREWYLSPDQRNRATVNGIWEVGYGFQLSGRYLYGDNGWATPTSGVDVRQTGLTGGSRLRADGTLIPRNSFDIPSIHKVDLRLQRRFKLGARASLDGMVEVFNAFNHRNLVTYVTNMSSSRFGQASGDTNIDYQPRMLQLGFRALF